MRNVIALILGLFIGGFGGMKLFQSLAEQNEVPRAVMHLMGYHLGQIGDAIKAKQCAAEKVSGHVATLGQVAMDIEPIFLPIDPQTDKLFAEHAQDLLSAINAASSVTDGDCNALAAARKQIGDACKACHRDFR